jgi:hypothetical protein
MMKLENMLLAQITVLSAGAVFAWYTVYNDFVSFFSVYDTIFRFNNCTPPNPFTQACFYGAFVFIIALVWSVRLYKTEVIKLLQSQRKLTYLLIVGTLFGWSNFSYMIYTAKTATPNGFTCIITPETSPFTTACFIGSVFFTLGLLIAFYIYRTLSKNSQNVKNQTLTS